MTTSGPARRWGGRLATLLVAVGVMITVTSTAAVADTEVFGDGDGAVVKGDDSSSDQVGGEGDGDGQTVISLPQPYKEFRYVPDCSQNALEGGADALCGSAVYTCPREGDIRYRVYTRQHDANGDVSDGEDWEPAGTQCRGPDEPADGGPVVITTADIAAEARKAAPATVIHVEPVTTTYVNVPTNFYADSAAQDATVELLGQTIDLRFQPSGFAWSYGDGATGSGAGVKGAPVGADGAVEHAYRRSADVQVTLTRTFDVTFNVPGGASGTLPAPGVSNTSAPYPLEIGEIQSLVTGNR